MARITVEAELKRIPNRYDLTLIASMRARELVLGKEAQVDVKGDKPTVVALREIAEGKVDRRMLRRVNELAA